MLYKSQSKSGFTLLEILLVVGIIAILTGIVIIAINPSKQLATVRNTERVSDLKQINNALQQYYIDHNRYPSSLLGSLTEVCATGASSSPAAGFNCGPSLINLSELVPNYLAAIPADPQAANPKGTGYKVVINASTSNTGAFAPQAELGQTVVAGATCGDLTNVSCWSKERDAERVLGLKQIRDALELYYAANGHYPLYQNLYITSIPDNQAYYSDGRESWSKLETDLKNYIYPLPVDPINKDISPGSCFEKGGRFYTYWNYDNTGQHYSLFSSLENPISNNDYIASTTPHCYNYANEPFMYNEQNGGFGFLK